MFQPETYWEKRYASGGDSGDGSRGEAAEAKARYLAGVIAEHEIATVVDWGCGDGNVLEQLEALEDRTPYVGVDLSPTILEANRRRFATVAERRRFLTPTDLPPGPVAELAISSDVLHHFTDDAQVEEYLDRVFSSAGRFVAIYCTDHDAGQTAFHVVWRNWTPLVEARFGETFTLDAVAQGRRKSLKAIDPTEPAWYLYRRVEPLETPIPRALTEAIVVGPEAGPVMHSNPDLLRGPDAAGGDEGKA